MRHTRAHYWIKSCFGVNLARLGRVWQMAGVTVQQCRGNGGGMSRKADQLVMVSFTVAVIAFTALALIRIFKGSAAPMTTSIMDLTQFDNPEQIGAVLYRRFWLEIRDHPVVILCGTDMTSQGIWSGFRDVAPELGVQFSVATTMGETAAVPGAATSQTAPAKHALIIMPNSPMRLADARERTPNAFAIFESGLPLNAAERADAKRDCKKSQFACLSLIASRQGHLKKVNDAKWTAAILQLNGDANTIFVFVHGPR